MSDISSLSNANRVEIFKHLAVDDLDRVRLEVLDSIAVSQFHEFIEFCDKVYSEKDKIESISCTLEDDQLQFNIEYK